MQWPVTQVLLPCTVAGMPLMKMMTQLQRRALKNWSELTQVSVLMKYKICGCVHYLVAHFIPIKSIKEREYMEIILNNNNECLSPVLPHNVLHPTA